MKFKFLHSNINVLDLGRSISFYGRALGLKETRRIDGKNFTIVFMGDGETGFLLELTNLHERTEPYELGDNESHIAFEAPDFDAAHKLHAEMGCICFENQDMGIYFIEDPDGYWMEVIPHRY
ncbi:MAG: VOC family protein [Synergistaceae bacterium]|nr:VOC family protein [Synergistaceae bacterium]